MNAHRAVSRMVLTYVIFASVWIAVSDLFSKWIFLRWPETSLYFEIQLIKGIIFVFVTGGLLGILFSRYFLRIEDSEKRLESVIESIADGVLVVDSQGDVTDANRAALGIFGVQEKAELLISLLALSKRYRFKKRDGAWLRPEEFAATRANRGEVVRNVETILERGSGEQVIVSVSGSPVRETGDSSGQVSQVVLLLKDVTELRKLERLRDEFISTAAHELKTPLAVIKANAQLLMRSRHKWESKKTDRVLGMVDVQCDQMNRLVQELLDDSRIAFNRFQLKTEELDLGELVEAVVERMRAAAPRHRLILRREGEGRVEVDRARLEQVVQNLLDNAIRFSPQGGLVEILSEIGADQARVTIEDHGIGIPEQEQGRVFEKYFRVDQDSAKNLSGMGVGLSLSREIIQRHGGEIRFRSTPGQGSVFFFSLPLVESARFHGRAA